MFELLLLLFYRRISWNFGATRSFYGCSRPTCSEPTLDTVYLGGCVHFPLEPNDVILFWKASVDVTIWLACGRSARDLRGGKSHAPVHAPQGSQLLRLGAVALCNHLSLLRNSVAVRCQITLPVISGSTLILSGGLDKLQRADVCYIRRLRFPWACTGPGSKWFRSNAPRVNFVLEESYFLFLMHMSSTHGKLFRVKWAKLRLWLGRACNKPKTI